MEYQPDIVECKLVDAWNHEHIFHEKVPVVSMDFLNAESNYLQPGKINCKIVRKWTDPTGRIILTVNTELPWGIYSLENLAEFDVVPEQVMELE